MIYSRRFFSSTGYHRSGENLPGYFQAVTYDTVSDLETALDDKFRTIIQNTAKYSREDKNYYSSYLEKAGWCNIQISNISLTKLNCLLIL